MNIIRGIWNEIKSVIYIISLFMLIVYYFSNVVFLEQLLNIWFIVITVIFIIELLTLIIPTIIAFKEGEFNFAGIFSLVMSGIALILSIATYFFETTFESSFCIEFRENDLVWAITCIVLHYFLDQILALIPTIVAMFCDDSEYY